jgi:hypothetical protein
MEKMFFKMKMMKYYPNFNIRKKKRKTIPKPKEMQYGKN